MLEALSWIPSNIHWEKYSKPSGWCMCLFSNYNIIGMTVHLHIGTLQCVSNIQASLLPFIAQWSYWVIWQFRAVLRKQVVFTLQQYLYDILSHPLPSCCVPFLLPSWNWPFKTSWFFWPHNLGVCSSSVLTHCSQMKNNKLHILSNWYFKRTSWVLLC